MKNEKTNEKKREHKAKQLGREEFGFGMDLSPDDFDVIGQNDAARRQNQQANPITEQKKMK